MKRRLRTAPSVARAQRVVRYSGSVKPPSAERYLEVMLQLRTFGVLTLHQDGENTTVIATRRRHCDLIRNRPAVVALTRVGTDPGDHDEISRHARRS